MQSLKTTLVAALALSALFGCESNTSQTVEPVKSVTIKDLPADPAKIDPQTGQSIGATGKFTLVSLKNGLQVPNSDSATNKWDIGFRATTLIVNGGKLRTGQGGAFIYTGTFDELKAVPAGTTFATDESSTQLAIPTGSGKGWYNYANTLISPIPGRVLLIRTGDGKYAKVEILSYYKNAPAQPDMTSEGRYYTFRYVYQPDGSTNLN
ncbi:HmuY family protein [Tellurirhabdus rosea]|uniref:HmuY family protein n=1 Tax=Tellurirhabdus rosea TaxID=2674997 RepID=UPI002256BBB6|nr:HmuY family protein [Tellurirhabdus rosea]